ncbi:MAG: prepilin-type N-terminal cleavage/methylation domain-containing protein [bacterium]|nr:prepilin-type N-terminal cleavage/methylation domain-containing protein [bacterium]
MKKGFTLVEFLVSFAIVALVAGISVTYLRQAGPGSILRAGALDLATDLRYASELAVSTQVRQEVRFNNPSASSYTIVALSIPEQIVKTIQLDSSLTFGSITLPSNTAEFNSIGSVFAPGTVILQHQNGMQKTIDIRPSGYVQMY